MTTIETTPAHGLGAGASGGSSCCGSSCDFGPFTRNNYWYGKLMLPQDFTDEQTYFRDKLRHHNQRLHGTGVVCGLIVTPDSTPGCRDRIIDITPGTALDCCGNEIVVHDLVRFDLTALPAVQALAVGDDTSHELRICLRYRECGTEPVPVLYDDCGCDDGRCLPNRILESYEIDVVIDPPATTSTWSGAALVRDTDLGVADAQQVRVIGTNLFVAAGNTLHQFDATTRALLGSHDLGGPVHALDAAADGSAVFAVHDDAAAVVTLTTLAAVDLSVLNTGTVPNGATPLAIAAGSAGGLAVLLGSGALLHYGADVSSATPSAPAPVTVPVGRTLLALSADAATAYVAAPSGSGAGHPTQVDVVDLTANALGTPITALPAGAEPTLLKTTATQLIVTASDARAYAIDPAAGTVLGSVPLVGTPFAAAGAPWAFVLDSSGGQSHVRPVHLTAVGGGGSNVVGPAVGFTGDAHDITVDASGTHVYVAYTPSGTDPGGIAIFDVDGTGTCCDGWNTLPICPSCDQPDCVVLATIHGYRPGFAMDDPADPPTDPGDDVTNHIARIDNRAGRHVLRSTELISETVECLLDGCGDTGSGGGGATGPTGPKGDPGAKGDPGKEGPAGPGLETGLTQITTVSWPHAGTMSLKDLSTVVIDNGQTKVPGLTIVFSAAVEMAGIDALHVFQVEAPNPGLAGQAAESAYICRCSVKGSVVAVKPILDPNTGAFVEAEELPGATSADAISFIIDRKFVDVLSKRPPDDLWVRLRGDFVIDGDRRAIDAEFTRHEFPTGDRPNGSPYGIQGGIFESWFQPTRDGQ